MAIVTEEWQRHAACKGPKAELFFPPTVARSARRTAWRASATRRRSARRARCAASACTYALRIREAHGIWGGTTELERRDLSERQAS